MNMDVKYQMKVGEAAVRILSIYDAVDPENQTLDEVAEMMMACITIVQLDFGKEWEIVEVDVLRELLSMLQPTNPLHEVVEEILQRRAVDFTSKSGDNLH